MPNAFELCPARRLREKAILNGVLAAADYASGFATCQGIGIRRLIFVLVSKHDLQPHGVSLDAALVSSRKVTGRIGKRDWLNPVSAAYLTVGRADTLLVPQVRSPLSV